MCNLYSLTRGQQAIRAFARAMRDRTGNLPSLPGIFPDYAAPIVRNRPDGRELAMARWGMPSPLFALKGKKCDPGVKPLPKFIMAFDGGALWLLRSRDADAPEIAQDFARGVMAGRARDPASGMGSRTA